MTCRWCQYSYSSCEPFGLILRCLLSSKAATTPCQRYQREPGIDDDRDDGHEAA